MLTETLDPVGGVGGVSGLRGGRRFLVVEKIGPAGTIARTSDPRQHA